MCVPTNLVHTRTVVHTTHTALTCILYVCLECTHLQKWWSLAGCHWWRPVWWFGFWCQPSRSSPPGHRSPPLWHHQCLAPLAPSWRSNKGCQCPHHGFQTAAHTGGTFSTLVRWLRNQSFKKVHLFLPDPGESVIIITTWYKLWNSHIKQNTFSCCLHSILYFHSDEGESMTNEDGVTRSPKQDCLLGESFIRCGQVQDAVRL